MRAQPEPFVVRRGSGTPIVAVHGNGVDHRILLGLDDALDAPGWERIYLDLPGFGATRSLPADGGLPALADWLVGTVDELVGSQPFALLGNSLGGLLARHVGAARRDRLRGIALIAPVVDPRASARRVPAFEVHQRDDALLAALEPSDRAAFEEMTVRQTAVAWSAFRAEVLPGVRAASATAMARLAAEYTLEEPEASAEPTDVPSLIVCGAQDQVVGWSDQRALLDHYRRATFAVLDGAGHNPAVDQPDLARALIRDWRQRMER